MKIESAVEVLGLEINKLIFSRIYNDIIMKYLHYCSFNLFSAIQLNKF